MRAIRVLYSAIVLSFAGSLVGCATTTLDVGSGTVPHVRPGVGAGSWSVRTLTDLEEVYGVSAGPDHVYVATDRGLLVYPTTGEPTPRRLTTADNLPSNVVRAVTTRTGGVTTVATDRGLVEVDGASVVNPVVAPAPVGTYRALHAADDGTLWACGAAGVARRSQGGTFERFGEPAACTGLTGTPEGHLWVGTTRGLWYVEGDIIREHAEGQGLPAGYVRDVVPQGNGKAFALVQGPTDSYLAHFDGGRWYAYTIDAFDRRAVGLGRRGADLVLVTPGHAFTVSSAGAPGVALTPLSRSDAYAVRSYRARITAPANAPTPREEADVWRGAQRLSPVPPNHPTVDAPGFAIAPLASTATGVYRTFRAGGKLYLADRNRGVLEVGTTGDTRELRSRDLVHETDLQVVTDERGITWVMSAEGDLARFDGEVLARVASPEGVALSAVGSGPGGAFAAGVVTGAENTLRVYRLGAEGLTMHLERPLQLPSALASVTMVAVAADANVWACVRVAQGEGSLQRGCVEMSAESTNYHYRGANREGADGEGALGLIDEVSTMDVNEAGSAWFSSLNGAVRLGNHQAVVFGESRGVRGEVVSDVAVGGGGRVWIAAAEGIGYYEDSTFEFRMPQAVQAMRTIRLAIDADGNVWGAGPNGVARFDGTDWATFGEADGLPSQTLVDVEADGQGRVWLLGRDRLMLLELDRSAAVPAP